MQPPPNRPSGTPSPEWNSWTHEQAVEAARKRFLEGEKIRSRALHELNPDTTWREAERWIHDTSDDMRRFAHGWVVAFGNVNDLKMVSPTDGSAIGEHLDDKLSRLREVAPMNKTDLLWSDLNRAWEDAPNDVALMTTFPALHDAYLDVLDAERFEWIKPHIGRWCQHDGELSNVAGVDGDETVISITHHFPGGGYMATTCRFDGDRVAELSRIGKGAPISVRGRVLPSVYGGLELAECEVLPS